MKIRKCYYCYMPLKKMGTIDESHRLWKCPNCKNSFLWLDNPHMDNSYASLHRTEKGGFSTLSMISDPDMHMGESPQFLYTKEGVKTHRWHRGREEWIKIGL